MNTVAARSRAGAGARAGSRPAGRARTAAPGPEPWSRRDAAVPALLTAVGLVLLVWGWFGISGTVDLDSQTRWLALGILGLIVGGLGMVVWLLLGLRAVTALKHDVLVDLEARLPAPREAASAAATAPAGLGTVPGMRRYHRADCLMLAGKDATWADDAEHARAGLAPCGVCLHGGRQP